MLLPIHGEVPLPHAVGKYRRLRRGWGSRQRGWNGGPAPPHSWGGGAKRRRGWGMAWDAWARSLRLVGRARLLRQLIPADAVPDLRPQPPLERLRLVVDRLPELVEARVDQVAVDVELVEHRAQPFSVHLQRPVEAPVGGRDAGDVSRLDGVILPVELDRMVEDQGDDVDEVFAVDLVDLQLAQQQVGGADRGVLVLQASAEVDLVRHPENIDEHVDLAAVVRVVEVEASLAVHQVEAFVGLVAELAKQLQHRLAVSLRHRVVEVAVLAPEGRPARAG